MEAVRVSAAGLFVGNEQAMQTLIKGSLIGVENVVMQEFKSEGSIINKLQIDQWTVFLDLSHTWSTRGEKSYESWAHVVLINRKNDNQTTIVMKLHLREILTSCDNDFIAYEERKRNYEDILELVNSRIIKKFGKAEEETTEEPVKPKRGAPIFEWLEYREKYQKATGRKMTYKMLEEMSYYRESYYKQANRLWQHQKEKN